jgi:hypothetical protein
MPGFGGKQRRLMFGEYPAVSLAEARKRARHAFAAIDGGRDPAGEQQAAKARPTDTVGALAKEYVEKHVRVKQRGWKEEERVLNVNVLPSPRFPVRFRFVGRRSREKRARTQ